MAGRLRVMEFGVALLVASACGACGQQADLASTCEADPGAAGCRAEVAVLDGVRQQIDQGDAASLLQVKVTGTREEDGEGEEDEEDEKDEGVDHRRRRGPHNPQDYGPVLKSRQGSTMCLTGYNDVKVEVCDEECNLDPKTDNERYFAQRLSHENNVVKRRDDGSKCMDWSLSTDNVVMHPCHGGNNQLWHLTPEGYLKSQAGDKCLDYLVNTGNAVMHPCHGGSNQKWYWENAPTVVRRRRRCGKVEARVNDKL